MEYIITAKSILTEARNVATTNGNSSIEPLKLGLKALENAAYAILISRGISIRGNVDFTEVLEALNMHNISNELKRYRSLISQCPGSNCNHETITHEINNIEKLINNALNIVVHSVPHLGP